jgi:drug/metabolite transporter (DMT)-like permease
MSCRTNDTDLRGTINTMRGARPLTLLALAVALVAISSSAPLIAFAVAPSLAIAFWRNGSSVVPTAAMAAVGRRAELRALFGSRTGRRTVLVCVVAGVTLAVHFATWIPSAKLTSVAMAVALVCTTPVWVAVISAVRGVHVRRSTWLGIGVAVSGVALSTGADLNVSGQAVAGDALALAGGVAAAVYTVLGERVRASTSTTTYTLICYTVCAVVLLGTCLVAGVRLTGYSGTTWLAILAMMVGPQLLGHSLINYALDRVSATTISVFLLLEVPGAALITWLWLGRLPAARSVPGLVILMAGVAVVVFGARRPVSPAASEL